MRLRSALLTCVVGIVLSVSVGCITDKPLLMNDQGIYKFTDQAKADYFLFLNEKGEWERTHKKIKPVTEMVIFYEED